MIPPRTRSCVTGIRHRLPFDRHWGRRARLEAVGDVLAVVNPVVDRAAEREVRVRRRGTDPLRPCVEVRRDAVLRVTFEVPHANAIATARVTGQVELVQKLELALEEQSRSGAGW